MANARCMKGEITTNDSAIVGAALVIRPSLRISRTRPHLLGDERWSLLGHDHIRLPRRSVRPCTKSNIRARGVRFW